MQFCGILAREMSGKDIKLRTTLHGTDITVFGYDHSPKVQLNLALKKVILWTSVSNPLARNT